MGKILDRACYITFLSAHVKTGMRRRRDCMIPPERHSCLWEFKREIVVVPLSLLIQCEFRNLFRLKNYIRRQTNRGYSCSQTNPEHLIFIGFDKLTWVVDFSCHYTNISCLFSSFCHKFCWYLIALETWFTKKYLGSSASKTAFFFSLIEAGKPVVREEWLLDSVEKQEPQPMEADDVSDLFCGGKRNSMGQTRSQWRGSGVYFSRSKDFLTLSF